MPPLHTKEYRFHSSCSFRTSRQVAPAAIRGRKSCTLNHVGRRPLGRKGAWEGGGGSGRCEGGWGGGLPGRGGPGGLVGWDVQVGRWGGTCPQGQALVHRRLPLGALNPWDLIKLGAKKNTVQTLQAKVGHGLWGWGPHGRPIATEELQPRGCRQLWDRRQGTAVEDVTPKQHVVHGHSMHCFGTGHPQRYAVASCSAGSTLPGLSVQPEIP